MSDDDLVVTLSLGPLEIQGTPFGFLRHFSSDLSILLYGAEGTGKTSFIKAASDTSVEEIRSEGRTTAIKQDTFLYTHSDKPSHFQLSLMYSDSPGDTKLRETIFERICDDPPLVILLFLDHQDTRTKLRQDFSNKPNPKEYEIRNWEFLNADELGTIDTNRLEENRQAIRDLYDGICKYPVLRNYCSLIVPVVTKLDLWGHYFNKDYFYDEYRDELEKFSSTLDIRVTEMMFCSTTLNVQNGIYNVMKLIGDETKDDRKFMARLKRVFKKQH